MNQQILIEIEGPRVASKQLVGVSSKKGTFFAADLDTL